MDVNDLIDSAQPAERTILLCVRGDLVAEFENLDRERAEAEAQTSTDSLAGGGGKAREIAERMEKLRELMRESSILARLRAMPRKTFNNLVAQHPPRRDDDGQVNPDDSIGVNVTTFFDPLIRACWVDPVIEPARFTRLLDEILSDRQYDELGTVAWAVNRGEVDIPFSYAAYRLLHPSEAE